MPINFSDAEIDSLAGINAKDTPAPVHKPVPAGSDDEGMNYDTPSRGLANPYGLRSKLARYGDSMRAFMYTALPTQMAVGKTLAEYGVYPLIGFLDKTRRGWVANQFNLRNYLNGNNASDEVSADLALEVLAGNMTPREAYDKGMFIDAGERNLTFKPSEVAANTYRILQNMGMDYSSWKNICNSTVKNLGSIALLAGGGPFIDVKKPEVYLSTNDEMGPLFFNVDEETWWREMIGDDTYEVLDRIPITPDAFIKEGVGAGEYMDRTGDNNLMRALWQGHEYVKRNHTSVMDLGRFTTFMFNDPIALATVPLDVASGGGPKAILRMSENGMRRRIPLRMAQFDIDNYMAYQAERMERTTQILSRFPGEETSKAATDAVEAELKLFTFNQFNHNLRMQALREGTETFVEETPKMRELRTQFLESLDRGESNSRLSDIMTQYNELRKQALKVRRVRGITGFPIDDVLDNLRTELANSPELREALDINNLEASDDLARRILMGETTMEDAMSQAARKSEEAAETVSKLQGRIEGLEYFASEYGALRTRLSKLDLKPEEIDKLLRWHLADMISGVEVARAGKPRLSGLYHITNEDVAARLIRGASNDSPSLVIQRLAKNDPSLEPLLALTDEELGELFHNIQLRPDEELMEKFLRRDHRTARVLHEWKKTNGVRDASWHQMRLRDPYNATEDLHKLGLNLHDATVRANEYLALKMPEINDILGRLRVRLRDFSPGRKGVRADRAAQRDLYGRLVSIESFIDDPDELIEAVLKSKVSGTTEFEIKRGLKVVEEPHTPYTQNPYVNPEDLGKPNQYASSTVDVQRRNLQDRLSQAMKANDSFTQKIEGIDQQLNGLNREIASLELQNARATGAAKRTINSELSIKCETRDALMREKIKLRQRIRKPFEILRSEEFVGPEMDQIITEYIRKKHPDLSDEVLEDVIAIRRHVEGLWEDLIRSDPDAVIRNSGKPRNLYNLLVEVAGDTNPLMTGSRIDADNLYYQFLTDAPSSVLKEASVNTDVLTPLTYVTDGVARRIHNRPVLEEMDLLIANAHTNNQPAYETYLRTLRRRISGESDGLDRTLDMGWSNFMDSIKQRNPKVGSWLEKHHVGVPSESAMAFMRAYYRSALYFNPGFTFKNLFGSANTISQFTGFRTIKGLYTALAEGGTEITRNAALMRDFESFYEFGARSNVLRFLDRASMSSEYFNRGVAFWTGFRYYADDLVKQGIIKNASSGALEEAGLMQDAIRAGVDAAYDTQHIYGPLGRPVWQTSADSDLLGSKFLRPPTQFVSYAPKQTDFLLRQASEDQIGFIRMLMLTGWASEKLERGGIDATKFVGAMYEKDASGPAADLLMNIFNLALKVDEGDVQGAQRNLRSLADGMRNVIGGAVGIPMTPVSRGLRYLEESKDPSRRDMNGRVIEAMDKRDVMLRAMGIPQSDDAEREWYQMTQRMEEARNAFNVQRVYNRINTIINDATDDLGQVSFDAQDLDEFKNLAEFCAEREIPISNYQIENYFMRRMMSQILLQGVRGNFDNLKAMQNWLKVTQDELDGVLGLPLSDQIRMNIPGELRDVREKAEQKAGRK